jgi:hypothetical protein
MDSDADIDALFTDTGLGKDDPRERPLTRMTPALGVNGRGRPQGGPRLRSCMPLQSSKAVMPGHRIFFSALFFVAYAGPHG